MISPPNRLSYGFMAHSGIPDFLACLELKSLREPHLEAIYSIEKQVYEEPWTKELLGESLKAPMTYSVGLFRAKEIVAYAIYQVVFSEGHLLNLAVHSDFQSQGVGSKLLDCLLQDSQRRGAMNFFLEVRPSNTTARKLYEKRGFKPLMIRERYYANGEAALIMVLDFMSSASKE